jgi:hypothetical protein
MSATGAMQMETAEPQEAVTLRLVEGPPVEPPLRPLSEEQLFEMARDRMGRVQQELDNLEVLFSEPRHYGHLLAIRNVRRRFEDAYRDVSFDHAGGFEALYSPEPQVSSVTWRRR